MIRSTTPVITRSSRHLTGGRGSLIALVVLAAALVAIAVGAGAANAASTWIGSDLDSTVQPSNASQAHDCDANPGGYCSWVMGEAYGNPGGEASTKDGYLKKIKLIGGEAGSFKLQVVKTTSDGHTKLVRNGPKIHYDGQQQYNWDNDDYNVEKYKTHLKIKHGERLAIKAKSTSTLRCSSGGSNILQYSPVLKKHDGYRIYEETEGCYMLIEGKVKYSG